MATKDKKWVYTPEQHKAVMEYIKRRREERESTKKIIITKERIERLNKRLEELER